ncbi:uncharacterized protein LOC110690142 isoform X2 [Chenopodium quinoa]|uniref:uncharacterized protein LOC110690142 isoform X2 n=1 Tax=Chenopodium quinoa TaxID=63459 RepID=UPI000B78B7CA|nr:uncharacterized protein LOC110690142 isoform X2 [Chenopodium quinoa]
MKPWEVYEGYFTEEKWKRFEIYSKSAEFKEKSEKGKENAKLKKCRHHLGRNSFQRAWIIWNKQKRLENRFPALAESSTTGHTSQSSTSTGSIFDRRALEWVLAHEKRLPDGTWGIDPKDTETIRIANIVEENLQKQAKESEEGECKQSERGVDALTLAFGKKDHRGFVKGLGGCGIGVGYRKAFGPVKGKNMSKSGCSLQELDEFKENLTREFEEKLKEDIAAAVNSYLSAFIRHMTVNDLQVNDAQPSPSYSTNPTELSPRLLEIPTKCLLALVDEFSGNSVIVADGTIEPCPSGVIHNKKMNRDIYRVSVDHVYSDYSHLNLPEETDVGITKLGEAKGYDFGKKDG